MKTEATIQKAETILAYIIYFKVLATAGATNLLLVTFLIPLSAILLGVMVLGEQLGWNAFVGMGLIFMGLIAMPRHVCLYLHPETVCQSVDEGVITCHLIDIEDGCIGETCIS